MYSSPREEAHVYIYIYKTSEEERRLQIFPENCFNMVSEPSGDSQVL